MDNSENKENYQRILFTNRFSLSSQVIMLGIQPVEHFKNLLEL